MDRGDQQPFDQQPSVQHPQTPPPPPAAHPQAAAPTAPVWNPAPGAVWPAPTPHPADGTEPSYGAYPTFGPAAGASGPGFATVPPTRPARGRRVGRTVAAGVAALALVGAGIGIGSAITPTTVSGSGSAAQPESNTLPQQRFPGFGGTGTGSDGTGSSGSAGVPGGSDNGSDGTTTGRSTAATDDQSRGVVVIDTVLGYRNAAAAGTGMVLSSDGTVLTNNHVVEGATSIRVTVVSTGQTYNASVVGTDAGDDVAVIKLQGASGLSTVTTDATSNVAAGTAVLAVGNAGGTGSLTAATGTVTATGQSITATDESGANAEKLTGLVQTNADIRSGDSGGPLFDSDGEVIGINTAAATTQTGATAAGYAIPIGTALTIARQIEAGQEGNGVEIGLPAFLGVSVAPNGTGGATVAGVIDGLPAARAGLQAGDVITAVNGTAVGSADALSTVMAGLQPGQSVPVTWTTAGGQSQTATITLVEGPAV